MTEQFKLIGIIGKSGAGKDTVLRLLSEKCNVHKVTLYTSRPRRWGESEGQPYHFINDDEFLKMLLGGKLFTASVFRSWGYGAAYGDLLPDACNAMVLDPTQLGPILEAPEIDLYILFVQADDKTRLLRSLYRERNPDCKEICRRFIEDEKDFQRLFNADVPFFKVDNAADVDEDNLLQQLLRIGKDNMLYSSK